MSELHRELGERVGILPEYLSFDGARRIQTPTETYRAILASLGFKVESASDVEEVLKSISVDPNATPSASVRCVSCDEIVGGRQLRGVWCNLYSIRSTSNWGVGDFGDLRRLVEWAGQLGLDFVTMNPLHALRNRGDDISPYRPVSRLYRNEVYLEIEAIPEFDATWKEHEKTQGDLKRARAGSTIHYGEVSRIKREMLQQAYRVFAEVHGMGQTPRGAEYLKFLEREGMSLLGFATFAVLDEMRREEDRPDELPPLDSDVVTEVRRNCKRDIDFHCFIQFELDRQLASIAKLARDSGMSIGLMGDLAIGTSPDGSDPWAFPDLFLRGVSIGAPPDDLGPQGQNWALPPMNPRVLIESNFAYWRKLLQSNLAHLGALRIDHVMGLLRQFWIPEGFDGSQGAYMQFPAEQLFTILAEESQGSGTIIVGEDLGTVPEGFRELLDRFGVLSTRVMHFEREWGGEYKPASSYPRNAFMVLATHDMVPLAGFAEGCDLQLRKKVGLLTDDSAFQTALRNRNEDWSRLCSRLVLEGLLDEGARNDLKTVLTALIQFLRRTPCAMAAVSVDDLAGEREPINVPGAGQERHASWSRRMTMTLEEIVRSPTIAAQLKAGR